MIYGGELAETCGGIIIIMITFVIFIRRRNHNSINASFRIFLSTAFTAAAITACGGVQLLLPFLAIDCLDYGICVL